MKSKLFKYLTTFLAGFIIGAVALHYYGSLSQDNTAILNVSEILQNPIKGDRYILPVRVYQQETEYSCGGAAVKSILDYYGLLKGRSENDLSMGLKTGFTEEDAGTHPDNMIAFLKSEGLDVVHGENANMEMAYHYLDQGIPVMVLDSTWSGHWRLIIGYDFGGNYDKWEDNSLFFADPEHRTMEPIIERETGITSENESRFFYEWYENVLFEKPRHRFYIVAYPKDKEVAQYKKKGG